MSVNPQSSGGIVIVGAGHAGTEAVFALRLGGLDGPITLINGEETLPYQRPPLSKSFLQHGTAAPLRSPNAFANAGIDVIRGRVREIDRAGQTLYLDGGKELRYEHLILAVGAEPNRLAVAEGLFLAHLNDLQSAERLRGALPNARRVAIIGAGFIGMEFAAAAVALGKQVTVVDRAARVLERAASRDVSRYLEHRHQSRGVKIILDVGVIGIRSPVSSAFVLTLSNGVQIDADLVVEAVGVTPRIELAKQAGLQTGSGIMVDHDLLTSDPRISAIGDCAQFPRCDASQAIVLTSVQNSADQAKYVARRLSGVKASYSAVPWFWSDQADDKLQIVGLVPQCADRVVRRSKNDRSFSIFSFQNDLLASVETLNFPAEHVIARRLLGASVPVRPQQAEDPKFDLASLLRAPPQTAND
ncbi:NAD(P)/FAD-dependent oxidoreductase [Bradyrhizobium sp. Pha-3]|uniref:NAD(P)/FAD-dependent oxidoreductase n=1 Tax=Bradyrhizobium sp. Pha-3 TaxID=208375 RepID=UPI0035D3EB7A